MSTYHIAVVVMLAVSGGACLPASRCSLGQQRPADKVSGQVVDMRGSPVPAANVTVLRVAGADAVEVASGLSDGSGSFMISGVEPRARGLFLHVAAAGRSAASVPLQALEERLIVTLAEAVDLSGVVPGGGGRDPGGATVRCMPKANELCAVTVMAVCDANGKFTLKGVPVGPVVVAVLAGPKELYLGEAVAGREESVSMKLADVGWTRLKIRWGNGLPPGPIRLHIQPVDSLDGIGLPWSDIVVREEHWEAELPNIQYDVYWSSSGCEFAPASRVLYAEEAPHDLKIACSNVGSGPPAILKVVDERGEPVVGAVLMVRRLWPPWGSLATTNTEGRAAVDGGLSVGDRLAVTSYTDGLVVDGAGSVEALGRNGEYWDSLVVRLPELREVVVRLRRGAAVKGSVLDAGGDPFVGCGVWLQRFRLDGRNGEWESLKEVWTRLDGTYEFVGVPADGREYRVAVNPGYGLGVSRGLRLGGPSKSVAMPVIRAGRSSRLEGRVQRSNGEPLVGVVVRVHLASTRPDSVVTEDRIVVSDLHGEFCLWGLVGGQYDVRLRDLERPVGDDQVNEIELDDSDIKRIVFEWGGSEWIAK